MWWRRIVLWARVIAVTWAGLVGLLEVLVHYELVTPSPRVQPTIWIISLSMIGLGSLGGIIGDAVKQRFAERKSLYDNALMTLLIELSRDQTARFEDLGGSVYRPARWRRTVRHEDGTRSVRLKRVHRFRPSAFPLPSGITWTARTGAVGECWTSHRPVPKNWQAVAAKYQGPVGAADFRRVSKETKNGFSLDEFNAIAHRYSEVLAVPVWDPARDDKQVGVLSVDRLYAEDVTFKPILSSTVAQRLVAATSAAVGSILKPQGKND
ncbi:hypothetical protein [Microbacterium sp.]|uniref:hypothetical protein n=1 Tax=Microbacterium sp. TaxID=51671 RepID=UPI0039E25E8A